MTVTRLVSRFCTFVDLVIDRHPRRCDTSGVVGTDAVSRVRVVPARPFRVWIAIGSVALLVSAGCFAMALYIPVAAEPCLTQRCGFEPPVGWLTAFMVAAVLAGVWTAYWSRRRRRLAFQPPPSWPAPPAGWKPQDGWQLPEGWTEIPTGWKFWT